MDFTSEASFFATTLSFDDELARFLDDMSPSGSTEQDATTPYASYSKRDRIPSPEWTQDTYPSQGDQLWPPASLAGYAPSTALTLPTTHSVSPSYTAFDAFIPHSDLSPVTSSTTWSSPSEQRSEEVIIQSDGAQSFCHVEGPIHPRDLHRVNDREPLEYVGTVRASSLVVPDHPAVAYNVYDAGKGELQHDGWRAAAPCDSLLTRHVDVDADTSTIASTFPVSPGPVYNEGVIPQGQSRRGTSRETSSSDSPRSYKGKPYVCEYEDCSFDTDRLNNLTQHVKDVHLGLRPHACPACDTRFKRKSDLKRHHISYHTNQGSPRRKDGDGKTATARRKSE